MDGEGFDGDGARVEASGAIQDGLPAHTTLIGVTADAHTSQAVPPAASQPTPPESHPDHDLPAVTHQQTQDVQESSHLKTSQDSRLRSRSPLVLQPDTNLADPQSSPASTNGAGSSNTPVANAVSPDTSPDGESTVIPENLGSGYPTRRKGIDVPKRPDTPDSAQEMPIDDPTMDLDAAEPAQAAEDLSIPTQDTEARAPPSTNESHRKPSMRIDTQTNISSFFKPTSSTGVVESPAQITAATPRRQPPPTPSGQEDSSRRATRISSGVLLKKSVSEILGETPRTASAESPISSERDSMPADSQRLADRREKEKSKLSTVVFAKPPKTLDGDTIEVQRPDDAEKQPTSPERDYLYTLFENKAYSQTRSGPMASLIGNAHKAVSTADHLVDYNMQTECRILKRLYQLQEKGRWALRQPKRAEEAPRPTTHWDFLLDHMKWMRTDFREERKWKMTAARELAFACAEWVVANAEDRKHLQVLVRPPKFLSAGRESQDVDMQDEEEAAVSSHPTPDLIASHEDESVGDDISDPRDLPSTIAPAAIFSLGASDFNFATDKTPAFDKLLNELPLYEPANLEPDISTSTLAEKMDARWRTDIVPVSRYATEKLRVKEYKPPVKKSRYDYDVDSAPFRNTAPLPPRNADVALFTAENKHIRDRIHPGHSFRPPTEYPMPTQLFFETRSSSQWTHTEDDELRKLVKEYSYNWSLISSVLSGRSLYTSGADRRTPWECFERWIGLEGLPADMSKTPYFKTYSGRIEAATRHVAQQVEEAQRRAGANVQIPARKRTTQPVRVERKRTQRHLAMLDAMRKLAKKRETAIQKQQHQAELQAMRKDSQQNQPKAPFKNPSEYAALRQERDQKRAEQQEIYRQQLIAHQRAAAQAQRSQNAQANGMTSGIPNSAGGLRIPQPGMPGMPNGNLQVPNGQGRPPMFGTMNGMPMPPGPMSAQALARAQQQMAANIAKGINTSPQQMRMYQEAQKIQQEQLLRQQAQTNGQHSSPIGAHAGLANGQGMGNGAYMMGVNGAGSPTNNSSSPRSQSAAAQALSSGLIPAITQIQAKIREQNPTMSDEDVNKQASLRLQAYQKTATAAAAGIGAPRPMTGNQAAYNAAMGAQNTNSAAHNQNNTTMAMYPQMAQGMSAEAMRQYQQRMMQQQARSMGAPQMGQGMMPGMANSPVMNMARPVSQHTNQGPGQVSRSVTPRDGRSGSVSQPGQQGSPRPGSSRVMQQQS